MCVGEEISPVLLCRDPTTTLGHGDAVADDDNDDDDNLLRCNLSRINSGRGRPYIYP